MSTEKLDALIIRNLSDFDAAAIRLGYEIQSKVGKAIDDLAESWAKRHSWEGKFDFDLNELAIAPPEWKWSNPEERLGYFAIEPGVGDDWDDDTQDTCVDYFWLTRLCRAGRGMLGFRWYYGADVIGATKPKWKKFVQGQIQRIEKNTSFTYEETGRFFRPFRIDVEKLAAAFEEDDIDKALGPLREALDALPDAAQEFSLVLENAKKQFAA
jgi:hypothetical protein